MMMILLMYKDKNGTVQLYIFVHIFEISVVKKKKKTWICIISTMFL